MTGDESTAWGRTSALLAFAAYLSAEYVSPALQWIFGLKKPG
jgi:hypothetical protein